MKNHPRRPIRNPVLLIDIALTGGRGNSEVSVRNLPTPTLKAFLDDQSYLEHIETRLVTLSLNVNDLSFQHHEIARVMAAAADVVVIQTWIFDFHAVRELCQKLRAARSDIFIILGGPAAASQAANLTRSRLADVVVGGDWEHPIAELLRRDCLDFAGIRGITFFADGKVKTGGGPHLLADLGPLPSPYLRGFLETRHGNCGIEESRGCPYRCTYCYAPSGLGRVVRVSPIKRVRSELLWARDQGCSTVALYACNLDPSSDRFKTLGRIAHDVFGGRRILRILLDAHAPYPRLAAHLAAAPVGSVKFGVQSFSPSALTQAGRHARKLTDMVQAMRLGLRVTAEVILGLPGDTYESFRTTVDRLLRLGLAEVSVNWAIAIPGTPMGDLPERYGILRVCQEGVPYVLETSTLPRADMVRALTYVSEMTRGGRVTWVDTEPSRMFPKVPAMQRPASPHEWRGKSE